VGGAGVDGRLELLPALGAKAGGVVLLDRDGAVVGEGAVDLERPVLDVKVQGEIFAFGDGSIELTLADVAPAADLGRGIWKLW
jgi:hypothetical protein